MPESPMLTEKAIAAGVQAIHYSDRFSVAFPAFLAAQDRELLLAHGVAHFYDRHRSFPTEHQRIAMRAQVDVLLGDA